MYAFFYSKNWNLESSPDIVRDRDLSSSSVELNKEPLDSLGSLCTSFVGFCSVAFLVCIVGVSCVSSNMSNWKLPSLLRWFFALGLNSNWIALMSIELMLLSVRHLINYQINMNSNLERIWCIQTVASSFLLAVWRLTVLILLLPSEWMLLVFRNLWKNTKTIEFRMNNSNYKL